VDTLESSSWIANFGALNTSKTLSLFLCGEADKLLNFRHFPVIPESLSSAIQLSLSKPLRK
jgi:hypothetical protein